MREKNGDIRRRPDPEQWVSLSAADPLNLAAILTPGGKLAGLTANRLLFRGGVPVAVFAGGKVEFLEELSLGARLDDRSGLIRRAKRLGRGCLDKIKKTTYIPPLPLFLFR